MRIGSQLVQIAGSSVLLTGASGGIGHAIARALHARGAQLTLTGRRTDVLEPLAVELQARALAADLSDRAALERLLDDVGDIDILLANAALPASGRLESFSIEEIDRALDVNLRAPIVLARMVAPGMLERRRGHLLFVSSLAGKAPSPGASIYIASKAGLRAFSSALRADLHGSGVGVSTVFPGFISDAGMFADSGAQLPRGVGTRTPEDVARAVVDAIEHDRGETDVAPLSLRVGAMFAGVAPELATRVSRRLGSEEIAREIGDGQREKR
ncbi:MAG: SDR family NAD(P)-dependent oxidoreductase [Solirubrobacteraceae bacterium]